LGRVAREQLVAGGEALKLRRPQGACFGRTKAVPVDRCTGPGDGLEPRELQRGMRREQRLKNARPIEVVDALGVTVAVTRAHVFLHEGEALFLGQGQRFGERRSAGLRPGPNRGRPAPTGRAGGRRSARFELLQDLPRQIFAAVNLAVLGHDFLVPHLARGEEGRVRDGVEILRAGQVQMRHAVAVHHGEVQGLGVDVEPVLPELDEAFAPLK
jgi:hypothetical protein